MPEDVAALFAWANLEGARYWDFSESRRRYRQQVRALAAAALEEKRELNHAARLQGGESLSSGSSRTSHLTASTRKFKRETSSGPYFLRSQQYKVAEAFVESSRDSGKYQAALLWEPAPVRAPQPAPLEDPGEVWRRSLLDGYSSESEDALKKPVGDPALASPTSDEGSAKSGPSPAWIYSDLPGASAPRAKSVLEEQGGFWDRWPGPQVLAEQTSARGASLAIVFSLSGGVGRTSVLANLGRSLASCGERVAVGDTSPQSPLPLYFGARQRPAGIARAFASATRPLDEPVFVASYDLKAATNSAQQRHLMAEILRNGLQTNRILLDLPASANWLFRRIAPLQPIVLVPIVPDADAPSRVGVTEHYFEALNETLTDPLIPHYLLTQAEQYVPLQDEVRERLADRLGLRLLAATVRRSPLVAEALGYGLTVIEYAQESAVARDYIDVAQWIRSVSQDVLTQAQFITAAR